MLFEALDKNDKIGIAAMSAMATEIVRQHFDPLIGTAQNDYMIARFQSVSSIEEQLEHGYRYFFVTENGTRIGFLAFYPKGNIMYLSKFYLYLSQRKKGLSRKMMNFVIQEARAAGLEAIELNVNRGNDARFAYEAMGFYIARTEKNDIGEGFYMDDYVYRLDLS